MRRVPTAVAAVLLVTGLAACSSGPEQTTCGEVRAMSAAERADLVREVAAGADAAEPADAEALGDRLLSGCVGREDSATLDEVEAFPKTEPTESGGPTDSGE